MCRYHYGNGGVLPQRMPPILQKLNGILAAWCPAIQFSTACNVNQYIGNRRLPWHADDEDLFRPLEGGPTIISFSLGAAAEFAVRVRTRHRREPGKVGTRLRLEAGAILVMTGDMQDRYEHKVDPP